MILRKQKYVLFAFKVYENVFEVEENITDNRNTNLKQIYKSSYYI